MKEYFNYYVWQAFNRKVFHNTITQSDIKGRKFYLEKYFAVVGDEIEETIHNNSVYKAEKDDKIYLLDEEDIPNLPIMPKETKELFLKKSETTIHNLVTHPISARLSEEKTMSFKEFIDGWNDVEHSNEKTRLFLNMISVASQWKPIKLWLCSEPGTGKTSNYNIDKYIFNNVGKHAALTKAKLETSLFFNKVLVIDELTSANKAQMEAIEPIFLMIGDDSPELEKGAMARVKAMGKMDLSETSIIFTYNRVEDVKRLRLNKPFFEEKWINLPALKRRYPAILVEGVVLEKIGKVNRKKASEILEKNYEDMRHWAKSKIYFSSHLDKEMKPFVQHVEILMKGQALTNFEGVLDAVNAYCSSQEEYDEWCSWINTQIERYDQMIAKLADVNLGYKEDKVYSNYTLEVEQ